MSKAWICSNNYGTTEIVFAWAEMPEPYKEET